MNSTVEASALFAEYHDPIYRYILSMVRDDSEAEDLTQDTFLRAYEHQDSLRDWNAVRGWLYRIATHACLDRFRQRKAQGSIENEDKIASVPSSLPSALEIAERVETSACVQNCLDFLSDRYRAVILLHEAHSLTTTEIAETLGESEGAIKIRLHRARLRLRKIMEMGCAVSQAKNGVPCCEPKAANARKR